MLTKVSLINSSLFSEISRKHECNTKVMRKWSSIFMSHIFHYIDGSTTEIVLFNELVIYLYFSGEIQERLVYHWVCICLARRAGYTVNSSGHTVFPEAFMDGSKEAIHLPNVRPFIFLQIFVYDCITTNYGRRSAVYIYAD